MNEHKEQVCLVNWFRDAYPSLRNLFFAIPNGGLRTARNAMMLKEEGLLPGIPDLMLAVPSGKWHGLFLELKRPDGRVSVAQAIVQSSLGRQGYKVAVAYSYFEAKAVIVEYLSPVVT